MTDSERAGLIEQHWYPIAFTGLIALALGSALILESKAFTLFLIALFAVVLYMGPRLP